MSKLENINIKNRKASFEYSFIEKFIAGIKLTGTEIKSIRAGKANINEAFCSLISKELWVRNMHVEEYAMGNRFNHEPKRNRKLLLNKNELKKIETTLKDQGLTIIPLSLFINEKGLAKLEIAIAKGKKLYDKREDIKKKDTERETNRRLK